MPTIRTGTYSVEIRERLLVFSPELRERWRGMWKAWRESDRTTPSIWAEFEVLLATPGFRFQAHNGGHFAEAVAALELIHEGYECFRACALFPSGKALGVAKNPTELLEARLGERGLPLPREFKGRIAPKPRNPDLAAVHPRKGWRCSEVKLNAERPRPGQLEGLAVLHEVLGAQVEVVRVVPDGQPVPRPRIYSCTFSLV